MPVDSDDPFKRLLLQLAFLSTQPLTQEQIAKKLDKGSQSQVSKLLAILRGDQSKGKEQDRRLADRVRAATGGTLPWLVTKFLEEKLSPDLQKMLDGIKGAAKLRSRLAKWVDDERDFPEVRVFNGGPSAVVSERLEYFGRLAAGYVKGLLPVMGRTAVCWGKTLKGLVSGLRGYDIAKLKAPPEFIPVCGEPLGYSALDVAASKLAAELQKIVPLAGDHPTRSLSAVATAIPACFLGPGKKKNREAVRLIRAFFHWEKDYHAIFPLSQEDSDFVKKHGLAPPEPVAEPLIDKIESVLTSVGTPDDSDMWVEEIARMARLDKEKELGRLIIGNIGGYFIAQPNLSVANKAKVEEVNELWTGIREEHLRKVAAAALKQRRAAVPEKPGKAGIIVLAVGRLKAPMIEACIKQGLVQHLIIDDELADTLFLDEGVPSPTAGS